MAYTSFRSGIVKNKILSLLLVSISLLLLASPLISFGASDWQLQKNDWRGVWQSANGQFSDELLCARAAKQAITDEGAFAGSVRCFSSSTSEIANWSTLSRMIDDADRPQPTSTTNPPPAPGRQCSVETPSLGWFGYWGTSPSLLPCGPNGVNCLECGLCGFLMLGQRISYVILSFLVFIIAPIRFIWGGFQILVSGGSSESVSKGRKTIYYTVIGLIIGMSAFLIVQTFLWLLGGTGMTGAGKVAWPQINCQRNLNQYTPN